jgi:hypothetical protein
MTRPYVRVRRFAALLFLVWLQCGAAQKPNFDKYHVVPYGSHFGPGVFTTGQFASVLGAHLTPEQWCNAPHTQQPPYPLTVCGVQVLIDAKPAGLMYVGPYGANTGSDQINFQVPEALGAEGDVPFQVCVVNSCSDPLQITFTNKDILLWVEGKSYVHMPLWVGFKIPLNNRFSYPVSPCPWDFGGFQIEVRKDGRVFPTPPTPKCADTDSVRVVSAIRFGLDAHPKLPVHLFHTFETPGEYELRMSGPLLTPDLTRVARTGYSDWIRVTVEPYSETEREKWLNGITSTRNESEAIVSLLAAPDAEALKALMKFLPPPPAPADKTRVRLDGPNFARNCFAPAALSAFPDSLLRGLIPQAWLEDLRRVPDYCSWRQF